MEAEGKYYDAERQVQQKAFAAKIAGMETERAAFKYNIEAQIAIAEEEYRLIKQRYGDESVEAEAAAKRLVDIRQRLADQRLKIAEIEMRMEETRAQFAIGQEQLAAGQALALRQISAQQSFAIEADLENKLYAQKVAAIEKARALAGDDIVKQKELDSQLETLEGQHQAKLTQIANQAELDRKQFALQAAQAVEDSFGTLLNDLVSRTKTLKQTFLDFTKSLTDSLNRIASQQIAKQLFGAGSSGGGAVSDLMNKIFGGGATGGGGAGATAADNALTKLAATTATTTSDFSAVSIVSSATMQPAFAAVTSAAFAAAAALQAVAATSATSSGGSIIGSLGKLISGDSGGLGGFDPVAGYEVGTNYVPKDQLALVHRGEAIVPASMNPRGRASAGGGGMTVINHFNVQGAIDGRTQDQLAAKAALATQRASYRNL
jgi:hypothetical protein